MNRALLTGLAVAALLSMAAGGKALSDDGPVGSADFSVWQKNFWSVVKTPKKKPAAAPKSKAQYLHFELQDATVSKFGKAPRRGRLRSR